MSKFYGTVCVPFVVAIAFYKEPYDDESRNCGSRVCGGGDLFDLAVDGGISGTGELQQHNLCGNLCRIATRNLRRRYMHARHPLAMQLVRMSSESHFRSVRLHRLVNPTQVV